MRIAYFLSILILFSACKHQKTYVSFVPPDYFFPEEQVGNGKTFTYVSKTNGEKTFRDIFHLNIHNINYLIVRAYDQNGTTDSLVYLNRKIIENYSYMFGKQKIIKADIYTDTIIDNGKKLGELISTFEFASQGSTFSIETKMTYLKDTTLLWRGKETASIVTFSTFQGKLQNNKFQKEFNIESTVYSAKGIGEIKYLIKGKDNKINEIDLVDIKDMIR
ncbi:hypothetical protein LK994_13435 [Ferruginibacter lapsinanis]|uniref:hypothetical protein n=1 Tax=Ferruginibacter lapsinanis TaxID=563172 RepID=UPI001E4161FB|nr:hypothetical protein [Ferruginibacter lapsinanis]UEG49639.1 hypothetical protein LK994_13435 [Ferruginibacter lapsinanis]